MFEYAEQELTIHYQTTSKRFLNIQNNMRVSKNKLLTHNYNKQKVNTYKTNNNRGNCKSYYIQFEVREFGDAFQLAIQNTYT